MFESRRRHRLPGRGERGGRYFFKSSQSNSRQYFLVRAEMVPSQFCLPTSERTRSFSALFSTIRLQQSIT
jgi:hypothetical protein